MGVSSLPNRTLYTGDGVSTSFSFPYYFFGQTDMIVYLYDTILGAGSLKVLNSDYTISGTPNLQGLYQNGANIVFSVAPVSTSIVVIIRSPPELQKYSLKQNGNISSVALVQQMDYLTLLIQRLEDQIARAISVPDGLGLPFSGQLPNSLALSPGQVVAVNAAGNGFTVQNSPFAWATVTIPYASFQTAGTSKVVSLFSLSPGCILNGLTIKHGTAFSGTSITDVVMNVGVSADPTKFIDAFDVFASVADGNFDYLNPNYIASWANTTSIQIQAVSTGANLSALATGSVTVNYSIVNAF